MFFLEEVDAALLTSTSERLQIAYPVLCMSKSDCGILISVQLTVHELYTCLKDLYAHVASHLERRRFVFEIPPGST